MGVVKSFRELNVDREAREAAGMIVQRTKLFPREERYSLTDQVRRCSRAVNAMVAEAWARRRYKAAFINKIDEALGEAMETQVWLDHALDAGYINASEFAKFDSQWQAIGGCLVRMIDRADDFCKMPPNARFTRQS